MKPKGYEAQRQKAKARGIPWHFTPETWQGWWFKHHGPDWLKKRGRNGGQYVMARKGDTGPYSPENVECVTAGRNHLDATHFNGKLDAEMVRTIYLSTYSRRALATLYRVDPNTIRDIKRRHTWAWATIDLGPPGKWSP